MSDSPQQDSTIKANQFSWKITAIICSLIIVVGTGLIVLIYFTVPQPSRTSATRDTAMLVRVVKADTGTFRPNIRALGTVKPAREITLQPRVSGEIIGLAEEFTPGGFLSKGDTVVQLDPTDYENTLRQRQSQLRQARADLELEMGRQDIAREEYQLMEEELTEENRALVLRRPQLNSARASVESAMAAVEQARLNLQRTTVKAPFNARVLTRNVNLGSQVNAGANLARIVGQDAYWIETTLELAKLRWLRFPEDSGSTGAPVRIHNNSAWSEDEYRTGHLYKQIGELDDQTRMARVLVKVNDPHIRETDRSDSPTLTLGSFVETRIKGRKIPGVVRLNRDYVRKQDTVWVMENQKLDVHQANVVFRDQDYAYIKTGLEGNERVITTNISTVVEGTKLRLRDEASMNDSKPSSGNNQSEGAIY